MTSTLGFREAWLSPSMMLLIWVIVPLDLKFPPTKNLRAFYGCNQFQLV